MSMLRNHMRTDIPHKTRAFIQRSLHSKKPQSHALLCACGTWSFSFHHLLRGLFSEEFLFRGFLTRLISKRFRHHATIWIIAVIFSFIHFQFLGFIPRMLLGALFGYMAWWSGTLWTAVLAHIVNNTLVIVASFIVHYTGNDDFNAVGTQFSLVDVGFIVVSALAFYFLLRLYRREALRPRRADATAATSE